MYIHNLKARLHEWRDRLYNTDASQLKRNLSFFLSKLREQPILNSILIELDAEADLLEQHPKERIRSALQQSLMSWLFGDDDVSETQRAIYHYNLLKIVDEDNHGNFHIDPSYELPRDGASRSAVFVQKYVDPLVHYLSDQLEETSSVLYLLEKYKKRSEWFLRREIREVYEADSSSSEKVLDQDLRKFLFDQGIDYPFSQPASPDGKADVVGLLHTPDPLVLEVKIVDSSKNYYKDRIIEGFQQIVSYADNYNKPIGYLLVFNMNASEVEIVTSQNSNQWPIRISFAGKTYFIIIVNLPPLDTESASKRGRVQKVSVTEEELTAEVLKA
uniref:hypothetical protein n=1 Tax=Trichocoleus desertorum TaxID=1481672 RepID=UPI0025B4D915|nr:hypothetical protein [Trichocoleus desertorum]